MVWMKKFKIENSPKQFCLVWVDDEEVIFVVVNFVDVIVEVNVEVGHWDNETKKLILNFNSVWFFY